MIEKFKQHEKGQALVEFALVFPLFLFMLLGMMDYGHLSTADTQLTNATQEAAKEYSHLVQSGYNGNVDEQLKKVVSDNVNTIPKENIQIVSGKVAILENELGGSGERVTVKVIARVPSLTNFSFKNVRIEREVTLRVPN